MPRPHGGRPRTRPDRVLAGKAYGSRANRGYLRRRGICCTIPEQKDRVAARKRKGSSGGRPWAFDQEKYKQRQAVECATGLPCLAIGPPTRTAGPRAFFYGRR